MKETKRRRGEARLRQVYPLVCLLAPLCAGCGAYVSGPAAAYDPGWGQVGRVLPAAAVDEAPEEVPRFLRPPVEPSPGPALPEGPTERAGRFGVRAGLLVTTAASEGSWEQALRAGLYYRGGRSKVFELGVDYAAVDADYGGGRTASSEVLFLRCDFLFGRRSGAGRKATLFLIGGAELGLERATWEPTGETADRRGASVNLGAGVGSPSGSWDARVVYSLLIGADNATGTVMAALGFSF